MQKNLSPGLYWPSASYLRIRQRLAPRAAYEHDTLDASRSPWFDLLVFALTTTARYTATSASLAAGHGFYNGLVVYERSFSMKYGATEQVVIVLQPASPSSTRA